MESSRPDTGLSRWLYFISLAAFGLGLLLGILTPGIFPPIAFLGELYTNLLKLIVIPLLMTQIVSGVYGAAKAFTGRFLKTLLLFTGMFILSFLIMAVLVQTVKPGRGANLLGESWAGDLAVATLADFFRTVIPPNIVSAMAGGSILPCTLFAFLMGIAAAKVQAGRAVAVLEDLSRIFSQILSYIMWLTPVGVFALIGNAVAAHGVGLIGVASAYILLAWVGCLVVMLLVMVLPVALYARISPIVYIKRVYKIWIITLSTCSSAATLPHTMRVCNEEFGVPGEITDIVVPMGCTIHMCGGAVSFCLLGLFTMQMANIILTPGLFLYMLLVATLMNMAAPGIPGGGIVLGATYLAILGAPTGFIGIYSGIYRLLDMAYTTLNVTGDITANVLIAESERRKSKNRETARI